MTAEIEVEVFRAGDYGARGAYSENDLDAIAGDYDPAAHEAPVTVDHRQDGPALGWVRAVRRAGKLLVARLGGLAPELLEQIRSGAFKKRSIELYRAAEWTGRPYLRSLSFLGACPPAVKGLADPVFSESDPQVWVEFDETSAELLEVPARADASPEDRPEPAAASDAGETAFADALSETRAVEALAENETACTSSRPSAELDSAVVQFCDELRRCGRFLPVWEDRGIARFLAALDDTVAVRFSEDAADAGLTLRAWFQQFLQSLAPSVPMGEAAAADPRDFQSLANPASFSDRRGAARIDPESVALHQRVVRYLETNPGARYADAVRAVAR